MDAPRFPLYRRSSNGLNWYRIEGPDAFTEVQRVGGRHLRHHLVAQVYPERVRVMELIAADGPFMPCEREEFEAVLRLCRPQGD